MALSRSSIAAKAELLPPTGGNCFVTILRTCVRDSIQIPVLVILSPGCRYVIFSRSPTNDNEMFWLLGEGGYCRDAFCSHMTYAFTFAIVVHVPGIYA